MIALLALACSKTETTPPDGDTLVDTDTDTDIDTDVDTDADADSDADTDTATDTGSTGGTTDTGAPTLTVTNGFGGGSYAPGTELHVWADVDPQVELASWSGDTALLDTPLEWNARLVMPSHDASLTMTAVPVSTPREDRTYTLSTGRRTVAVFPASGAAVGGVLFFHGAQYSLEEIGDDAAHTTVMQLHQAGYTVVSVPNEAEHLAGTGGWIPSTNQALNPDLRNVAALVDALRADGTLGPATPVYAWGMSSGGVFAHTVGAVGLADAVVAFCSSATSQANAITSAPTAWYLAANDQTFPDAASEAQAFQPTLQARGIPTDLYVHPPTTPYPERFTRVAGVDAATSAAIVDDLYTTGAVAPDGTWTVPGSAVHLDPAVTAGLTAEQLTAVQAEIDILSADHELYDDVSARLVAFLQSL